MEREARILLEAASRPYLKVGVHPYFFARGKLGFDPIFLSMLRTGAIPDGARILDLGCGQFPLAALLLAARERYERGVWPTSWPVPPAPARLMGIEVDPKTADWGRRALGERVSVETRNLRDAVLPDADVVAMFDVLHYLNDADQRVLLAKIAHALRGGGKLLIRVADAGAGWRFAVTRVVDLWTVLTRGRVSDGFYCRTVAEWSSLLESYGFRVERQPMSQGTPFANILLTAFRQP